MTKKIPYTVILTSLSAFHFTMLSAILPTVLSVFLLTVPSATCRAQKKNQENQQEKHYVGAYSSSQAHNMVWESKIYRQTAFLADSICSGRATGTAGHSEAAFWMIRQYERLGLLPINGAYTAHFYEPLGRNVIGFLPGSTKKHRDSYVIVMAHYDGLGTLKGTLYPGADSNASGVVAMIGICDMFVSMRHLGRAYDSNVIFVGLDAKSHSMKGARALLKMITDGKLTDPVTNEPVPLSKIKMVVNIDQIGGSMSTLKSGRKDYLIMLGKNAAGEENGSLLSICNHQYGTDLELAYDYYGSDDFTNLFYNKVCEQKVFLEAKVPAVLFTSGITMNNNKPYDNAGSLDMEVMKRRIWLMFHWIEKIL